jgi:large subunit ribosomal protein L29
MQPSELRDLGDTELAQKTRDLREEVFRLKLRRATGQVENRMTLRIARRDLARALTIQGERNAVRAHTGRAQAALSAEKG